MDRPSSPCPRCGAADARHEPARGAWVCAACAHAWRDGPAGPVRLFLSYGRRDAQPLADRLRADLEAHGYEVWQDVQRIRPGHAWEQEIADGLRSTQLVLALLSPHAVRVTADPANADRLDSVCLDEISFARFARPPRPVVPVMALPCEPPFCIFRLDYVDMTRWRDSDEQYRAGLRRTLEGIEAALRGEVRYRAWERHLQPLDFSAFMNEKRRDFCGRQWLFDEIDAWRLTSQERALLITGDPGTGKSALVAELVHRNPGGQVLAYHCCRADTLETLRPGRFVRSVAAMIASQMEGYAAQLAEPTLAEALDAANAESDPDSSAFEVGVLAPLERLPAPDGGPRYFILDALDEALARRGQVSTIVDLLAARLERLPGWLRLVATTRKDRDVLLRLRGLRARELDAHDARNLEDIDLYLRQKLRTPNLAERLAASRLSAEEAFAKLRQKTAGHFLFAQQAIQGLERDLIRFDGLDALPPGLFGLYLGFFRRYFPDENAYAPARRALEVVVAAREPLTEEQLARATALDAEAELPAVLRRLAAYLPERDGRFAVFHKSFADWLTHPDARGDWYHVRAAQGHRRLADLCLAEARQGSLSLFALKHLPAHLLACGRWDELSQLLLDLTFLEKKAEAGLIFDLTNDFVQAVAQLPREHAAWPLLRLVDEALRADVHFLARHPSCLFQCLWNRGWWHDCPEASRHYEAGTGRREATGPKLSALLEEWRTIKERASPGFRWLRSHRPPAQSLESAQVAVFRGHEGIVTAVAFSPDGQAIASGSSDHTIRLWDRASGAQLACLQGHRDAVHGIDFSRDGRRLASASLDQTARVWDVATGGELVCFREHGDWVRRAMFSPDGQWVASGAEDWTVRLWDAATGRERTCCRGHSGGVSSLAFSPDGKQLLSGSSDGEVRLWDADTGRQRFWLEVRDGGIRRVSFAPDGRHFFTVNSTGLLQQWDAATGRPVASFPADYTRLWSAAFAPDGRLLAGGFPDRTVKVWDLTARKQLASMSGHEDRVFTVQFSADGRYLVSGGWDGTVRVWDTLRRLEQAALRDPAGAIRELAFAPDGRQLVSGGEEKALYAWNPRDGTLLRRVPGPETVRSLTFSPDGRLLAAGGVDGVIWLWETQGFQNLRTLNGHLGAVFCLALSPDGRRLASGSWDETVRLWDPHEGVERACLLGHRDRLWSVAFAPDGQTLVSASADGTARTWDAATGQALAVHEGEAARAALGRLQQPQCIVAVSRRLETVIQDNATGQEIAWWPGPTAVRCGQPDARAWAAAVSEHLVLFTLEGE